MTAERTVITSFENKTVFFKNYCKEKGLKVGDSYIAADFIDWESKLTREQFVGMILEREAKRYDLSKV